MCTSHATERHDKENKDNYVISFIFSFQVRLEKALDATEIPMQIATDNLECRFRRQSPDLVKDNVEIQLLRVSFSL